MMIHLQCWPRAPTSKIRPWADLQNLMWGPALALLRVCVTFRCLATPSCECPCKKDI